MTIERQPRAVAVRGNWTDQRGRAVRAGGEHQYAGDRAAGQRVHGADGGDAGRGESGDLHYLWQRDRARNDRSTGWELHAATWNSAQTGDELLIYAVGLGVTNPQANRCGSSHAPRPAIRGGNGDVTIQKDSRRAWTPRARAGLRRPVQDAMRPCPPGVHRRHAAVVSLSAHGPPARRHSQPCSKSHASPR